MRLKWIDGTMRARGGCCGWIVAFMFAAAGPVQAQLLGDLPRGLYGLAAASAPDEGLEVCVGLMGTNGTSIVGPDGNNIPVSGHELSLSAPLLSLWWVSPWSVLGWNYGAQLSLWGSTARTESPRFTSSSAYGFGDMWVQPLCMSKSWERVDALAGFALYIPTGTYVPGGDDNTGQGQWGYEFSAGPTVWLDGGHHWNFATLAFYDIYSPQRGEVGLSRTHLHTGDIFSLEGGLGYQFLDGRLNIGIPYSLQWKVTEDTLPPGTEFILPGLTAAKSRAVGVGAEIDVNWTDNDSFTLRWMEGFAGVNTPNGSNFMLLYTHQFNFGGVEEPDEESDSEDRS